MTGRRSGGDPREGRFDHLDAAGRAIGFLVVRPAFPVFVMVGAAAAIAWWWIAELAGSAAALSGGHSLGPGMATVSRFLPLEPGSLAARLADLCLSSVDPSQAGGALARFGALSLMWFAMAVAMMLPTAAPMLRTYAEIADTAAGRGETTIHVGVLAAGYLCVWALAALGFAGLQMALWAATGGALESPAGHAMAGFILVAAGLYQFLPLKQACLEKCRNPFTFLFANWKRTAPGVFRLGIGQGLFCLGCCWAIMLVMFAAGTMNIVWMAALTLFAFLEKTGTGPVTSRIGGTIVALWGAILLATAAMA